MAYDPVPGSVLALDIATRTGWAFGAPGRKPLYGVLVLPQPALDLGGHGAALLDGMADLFMVHQPARVVIERTLGAQQQTNAFTAECLIGLNMLAHTICFRWELPIEKIAATTVRAQVIGSGRAKKPDVMAWCHAQGFTPQDDNAGDALALLHFALRRQPERRAA